MSGSKSITLGSATFLGFKPVGMVKNPAGFFTPVGCAAAAMVVLDGESATVFTLKPVSAYELKVVCAFRSYKCTVPSKLPLTR